MDESREHINRPRGGREQDARKPPWWVWIVIWLVHVGLWLLYVAKFDLQETIAGLIAAGIATAAYVIVLEQGTIQFHPSLRDILQGWRIPEYLFTGTWEILQGLAKQVFTREGAPSVVSGVAFEVGGDDPESAARRMLAITYTTLTPNFIVLGIVRDQGLMLYHQIIPGEVLTTTKNLGAKP